MAQETAEIRSSVDSLSEMVRASEAARIVGVSLATWSKWEREGGIGFGTRVGPGSRLRPYKVYAVADLVRLRDELRRAAEPHADPERPGCYRVPVTSNRRWHRMKHLAIIDADALPLVAGKRWSMLGRANGLDVVVVQAWDDGSGRTPMWRVITGEVAPERRVVYANGDALDCRRANLVVTDVGKGPQRPRVGEESERRVYWSSRFKGVYWDSTAGMWRAWVRIEDTPVDLGRFGTEAEAAEAYDRAVREMLGEGARVNFPRGDGEGAGDRRAA